MWGLALIASQKSNLILRAFCVISFKMFHGKLDTRWRALRPEKSPRTDVSPLDLHLLSTCVFIYTLSESFFHEVTVRSVVFSESGSGFVSAPGIFAHAGSAVTESHYDFSAYAAHHCSSVTIFVLFSLLALSLILVDDMQICSEVSAVWFYLLGLFYRYFVKVASFLLDKEDRCSPTVYLRIL